MYEEDNIETYYDDTNIEKVEVYCDNKKVIFNYNQGTEYAETEILEVSYGFIYDEVIMYNIPYRNS